MPMLMVGRDTVFTGTETVLAAVLLEPLPMLNEKPFELVAAVVAAATCKYTVDGQLWKNTKCPALQGVV